MSPPCVLLVLLLTCPEVLSLSHMHTRAHVRETQEFSEELGWCLRFATVKREGNFVTSPNLQERCSKQAEDTFS
jgi:hypothetical protein